MEAEKSTPFMPDLIFDVGMHKGEDTGFYLKKGFNVVAFEAIPDLAEHVRQEFSGEIQSGRLRIVEGAIVPDASAGPVTFYRHLRRSTWGTAESEMLLSHERRGADVVAMTVPAVDFKAVLEETGIPYYLKIDIEGSDIHCLRALGDFDARPRYVSIEAAYDSFDTVTEQIDLLTRLGYDGFKAVSQARMHRRALPAESAEGLERFPS